MLIQILESFEPQIRKWKKRLKDPKYRRAAILAGLLYLYLAGVIAQFLNNRHKWVPGQELRLPSANPLKGLAMLFTPYGVQALLGLFFFAVIIILLYNLFREDRHGMVYDKERNFWYSQKGVYGTAGWMPEEDVYRNFDHTPVAEAHTVNEIIYGERDGHVLSRKPDSRLAEHVAVLGSSGTMKSRTYARGKIISSARKGESIVVTDVKGELAADCFRYLEEEYGYTCKILNLVDPSNSSRFYALDGCLDNLVFVANIVEAVITNTGGPKGDHFFDAAEGNLLSALIYHQIEKGGGELPTLQGAYDMITGCSSVEDLHKAFDGMEGSRAAKAYNLFRMASQNVQGNVIIGLGSRLSVLQNEEIAELTSFPDMDFLALGKEKTAYFLVLSDQDDTMRFVSAMYFSLLFLRLVQYADNECEGRRLPVKVNLILDEFCSIVGSINSFHIKMSNVRSRNIAITILIQSIGQLMNRYPQNMWAEILGNADCLLVLGCNDPVSASYVSDRAGEVTIYADTIMKQKNVFVPSSLQPVYRHSEGAGRRMLLTPDEVLRLPHSQMLVMLRGEQVIKLDKFDFTRNRESEKFRPIEVKGLVNIDRPSDVPDHPEELEKVKEVAAAAAPPPANAPPSDRYEPLDASGNPIRQALPPSKPPQTISPMGDKGTVPKQAARPRGDGSFSHTPKSTTQSAGKEVVRNVERRSSSGQGSDYVGPTHVRKTKTPKI